MPLLNQRITELTENTAPAADDYVPHVDRSDTTMAISGTTKYTKVLNLLKRIFLADDTQLTWGAVADGEFLKRDGTEIVSDTVPVGTHAVTHENGGSDEISVAGLSGVLADPQVPITENVQDIVGAMLVGGEYDDSAGTLRVGYLEIPQNSQSADYTAVLSDQSTHLFHPVGDNNPRTFTLPANASVAFRVGTAITFVNKINTLTIAITSDTLTWAEDGSTGSRSLAANGIATALKITSTEWLISGTGLS